MTYLFNTYSDKLEFGKTLQYVYRFVLTYANYPIDLSVIDTIFTGVDDTAEVKVEKIHTELAKQYWTTFAPDYY